MKKQLILSALIFSLSFSQATFTIEEDKTQNNLLADNPLFTVAKEQNFKCYTNLQKAFNESEKSKKHHTMLKHTLTLGGLSAIAASTYFTYSQGYSNVPLKKTAFTFFASGLGLLSKYIIDNSEKKCSDAINVYNNTANTFQKEIAKECAKKINAISIDNLTTKAFVEIHYDSYYLANSKVIKEITKLEDNPEIEKQIEKITKETAEIKKSPQTKEQIAKIKENTTEIKKHLTKKAENLKQESKNKLIENAKKLKKANHKLSINTQSLLDAIECQDAYKWYKKNKNDDVPHKDLPAHKSTITLKLFGLACCITWAPEICSNLAKMTNFEVPYFNNIKMPNLSTGFTMPNFKASPLCAYFKKLFFTKS